LGDVLGSAEQGLGALYAAVLRGEQDSAGADQTLDVTTNDRTFHAFGVQSTARLTVLGRGFDSTTELGLRLHADDVRRYHVNTPYWMRSGRMVRADGDAEVTADTHSTALAFAAHVQEDLAVGAVRFLPGLRAEVIRTDEVGPDVASAPVTRTILLPGLSIQGEPAPNVALFLGVHRGFSPVGPGEAAQARPETAWNAELGGRYGGPATRAELVGFFSYYDPITGACTASAGCDPTQVDTQLSGGRAMVWGIEAMAGHTVALRRAMSLSLDLTWTWTGNRFLSSFASPFPMWGDVTRGDRLPYVPEHQGAVRVVFAHPRGSVTLAGNGTGAMRDVASQGPVAAAERVPPLFLLDVAADVIVTRWLKGYVTVQNATNATTLVSLQPAGARPVAPIQVMVGVKLGR
jgi:Fe(3+) dicitrate transport protein